MTREGILSATDAVLAAVEAGGTFGPLHESIVSSATLCRALALSPETAPLAHLPALILWSVATLAALRPLEGREAAACRSLVATAGSLAAEILAHRVTPTPC